jgi:type II secretory ATPase GspE/PulE/Tfp pilus assembly ATPase PilB-like protein
LREFANKYQLGDKISEDDAKNVIDFNDKSFRKGEFVLIRDHSKCYFYAVFEGEIKEKGICYDNGSGILTPVDIENVFKIKDYRAFENTFIENSAEELLCVKKAQTVKWSKEKRIRIVKDKPHFEFVHDIRLKEGASNFKHLLRNKAISEDRRKFLKIRIYNEIVKYHLLFTHDLALAALKIRVLHDDELIIKFEETIQKLEEIEKRYENEANPHAKDLTHEESENTSTMIKLFMNEIIRRGIENRV